MSSTACPEGPDKTTSAQSAIVSGSTIFEGRLREMILGHGLKNDNHNAVSDPKLGPQMPTTTQQTPAPTASGLNQTQLRTPEPDTSLNRKGQHLRGRSGKSAPQKMNHPNGTSIARTPQDLPEAPLPYSIKPARQARRHQPSASTHPNAASPTAIEGPVQPPSGGTSQARRPNDISTNHPSFREEQPRTRYPNLTRPPYGTLQGQAPFPPQTNLRRGTFASPPHGPPYGRPHPHHQQLYNPYMSSSSNRQQPWFHHAGSNNQAPSQAVVQAQISYLDSIASAEIPKVEISQEEEEKKATVRTLLEAICQGTITKYELERDPLFDSSTVCLRCYGSLRTGFATKSSDMDLAIESPLSRPEISSVESEIPRLLEKALLDLGYGARLLTRTRIPLIRFCEKPTPELANRLYKERQKWEEERDSPPKKKKVKKEAESKSEPSETKAGSLPTADGIPGVHPPSDDIGFDGEMPLAEEIDEMPVSDHPSDSLQHTARSQDSEAMKPKAEQAFRASEASLKDTITDLRDLALTDPKSQQEQTHNSKPAPAMAKERREAVLSDDELIRLYKLAMNEGWFEQQERQKIYNFFAAVNRIKDTSQIAECRKQLFSLPDILNRYRPPPNHQLDYPTDGVGVQCDIIFSNPLAIHNSAMLRCYNLSDPRVKPMVLFIKAWAKRRKINSPYHGTLSSYGYVLMVLHYLVNVARPPICLNLQTVDIAARDVSVENTYIVDGYPVRFWRNESEIQQWAQNGLITKDRHSTIGSLLRGFFQYFAVQSGGFCWGMDVLSLRSSGGILSKTEKGWVAAKTEVLDPLVEGQRGQEVRQRYLFAIEDPFEINHNIARTVVHNGIVAIRDEFRRAHRLILEAGNGRNTEDLFAEGASKNDLNYRYFGPRPKPPVNKEIGQAAKPNVVQNQKAAPNPKGIGIGLKAANPSRPNSTKEKSTLANTN
ncbi:MAG: hypothetical protein L6R41_002769 [Letrouitia leprolyta]|nr:MAG: hypothetical protein L6R41_002769 [Letrouitia leprolyta]